ncbi:class I SAM-dependent methyltransferase [Pyruvatibacter sp.]|uniref:class I SAM-dependent methyltransferase n=1 Tax=Pyruvatibacter sp. TaxID=1981328 RepID=UPI0032EF768D
MTTAIMSKKQDKKDRKAKVSMAAKHDRHVLYQESVQCVEAEIDFVDETFKDLRGRHAELIREDFCGTCNTSCEWTRRRPTNRAICVDFDAEVLEWGRKNNISILPEAAQNRLTVVQDDVLTVRTDPVDAVLAMNFSYFCFKTRDQLRAYFKGVRDSLIDDGILFMDCYGGYEACQDIVEERKIDRKFKYVWEQDDFDPISNTLRCYIHFNFKDGSKMKRAFSYEWRMWSLPEIRELLAEAGFSRSTVYWEGAEEDSEEGNGVFEPVDRTENDPSWVAYIVAER